MIPCYNEEESICESMHQLHIAQQEFLTRYHQSLDILVIDDGSQDSTQRRLKSHQERYNFHIIEHPKNCGYGQALITGFLYALDYDYDWVISFDMDGQHDVSYLYAFYEKIVAAQPNIHIISGSRYKDPHLFWKSPWKDRFLVNSVITAILNCLGIPLTDSFCGMKAHRVVDINRICFQLKGYEMPIEMLLKAHHLGLGIEEMAVPVIYKNRNGVLNKERATRFIFAQAEKRLAKYLNIIQCLEPEAKNISLCLITEIYQKYYEMYKDITVDNFTGIQMAIIHEVAQHLSTFPCKCVYCKTTS